MVVGWQWFREWSLRLPTHRACERRIAVLQAALEKTRPPLSGRVVDAADSLETQLEYARYRLRARSGPKQVLRLQKIQLALGRIAKDLRSLKQGRDPFAARRGTFLRGYRSALDDTVQPYSLSIPRSYTGRRPYPLIVHLHHHGWFVPFQGHPAPKVSGAIVVSPHGRGSTDYMYTGEADVLAVLAKVRSLYNIDSTRVTLIGSSMGGTGCWNMAVRHPDLFAAIAPACGNTDSHVWTKTWGWGSIARTDGGRAQSPMLRMRQFLVDSLNPISYAENLMHVRVHCVHGAQDEVVPADHSRHMAARLRALGYPAMYFEFPNAEHCDFPKRLKQERLRWLLNQHRPLLPRHVRFKTASLSNASAYWVSIERFENLLDFAEVDAEVSPGHVAVSARNVARLSLNLSDFEELTGRPMIRIGVNNTEPIQVPLSPDGHVSLERVGANKWEVAEARQTSGKRPGLCGSVEEAFLSRFVLVFGTTAPSELERRLTREEALAFADEWKRRYGKPCLVKDDRSVTEEDLRLSNLILYGSPEANSQTARIMPQLPIKMHGEQVSFDGKTFRGKDVGVKLCFPNPLNPDRYVVVFAGVTWRAIYQINSRFGNWFDWGAYDNRNCFDYAIFDDRTTEPGTFLCVGFFDQNWTASPHYQWLGQDRFRYPVVPRHVPELTDVPAGEERVFLSDLLPYRVSQMKGAVQFDRSLKGGRLHVGQRAFERGLGVRAPSMVEYRLDGTFRQLEAWVGVDLEGEKQVSRAREAVERVRFRVLGDGCLLAETPILRSDSPPHRLKASLKGVHVLTLEAVPEDSYLWLYGSAAWGDLSVSRE